MFYDMEDIMLSETSQAQRDKHYVIPLNEEHRVVKVNETGSRTAVARGWGRGMGLV